METVAALPTAARLARARARAAERRLDDALDEALAAAAADPASVDAHVTIYEIAQLVGRPHLAVEHLGRAAALAPIHSTVATEHEDVALLVPCVVGTWTANTPLNLVVDQRRVTLHRWYVDPAAPRPPLPRHDAIFVAIGESDDAQAALRALPGLLAGLTRPVINDPAQILGLTRPAVARAFAGSALVEAPMAVRMPRDLYVRRHVPVPHIARPVGSHGGHGLHGIFDEAARAAFLTDVDAIEIYVSPFLDYRSDDGFYRKYRILFVDGVPYPCHLAISPRWMVHYYNAPMTEHAWMREEEARFLGDLDAVFTGPARAALDEVAARLPLPYVGIDCSIARDGRLVLFEADNALIVHGLDDPVMFAYKHRELPRVLGAIDAMLRRRAFAP